MEQIALNGRLYRRPARPTAVICADGCDPRYLEAGIAAGVLPTIAGFRESVVYGAGDVAMPTFTNPNNVSIVTGGRRRTASQAISRSTARPAPR